MPRALVAAFAGSLVLHAALLFLAEVKLPSAPEPLPLLAELRPLPSVPAPEAPPPAKPKPKAKPTKPAKPATERQVMAVADPEAPAMAPAQDNPPAASAPAAQAPVPPSPPPAAEPRLPARGSIRYAVYRGTQGLQVGQASHEWLFEGGTYRITTVTETSGLAAFFKPIRLELESSGKLVAEGLQPERLVTRRDGKMTTENADFDWNTRQVTLARDGRRFDLPPGAQDIVSFQYQLAFVPQLGDGTSLEIATGKKFGRYRIDAVGEEVLETPAGTFRTLHIRARTDDTTELWLALDRQMLPVKIRYTDRKGESFEQIAVELGMPQI